MKEEKKENKKIIIKLNNKIHMKRQPKTYMIWQTGYKITVRYIKALSIQRAWAEYCHRTGKPYEPWKDCKEAFEYEILG